MMERLSCYVVCVIFTLISNVSFCDNQGCDTMRLTKFIQTYDYLCVSANSTSAYEYFNAFPNSFVQFQDVFGYKDIIENSETKYGPLYRQSCDFIQRYFQIVDIIDASQFCYKTINICIGGTWQSDAVNLFQSNVINIITSSSTGTCYMRHAYTRCFSVCLKDVLYDTLEDYTDEEILSFWYFYLCSAEDIDENLYLLTQNTLSMRKRLNTLLTKAYHLMNSNINKLLFVTDEQISQILKEFGVTESKNRQNRYSYVYRESNASNIQGNGYKECYIMLCVELNVTKKVRPFPHNLDSRLFINTETPPELIICKHKSQNYFITDAEYLPYLSAKYRMSIYGTRCSDDVSWCWLLFV